MCLVIIFAECVSGTKAGDAEAHDCNEIHNTHWLSPPFHFGRCKTSATGTLQPSGEGLTAYRYGSMERVLDKMPSAEGFQDISFLFQTLGDATRLRILWLLCHCEECVCNIAAAVDMSAPAVSHHLRILKKSGIITSRREGKEVYYTLSDTPQAKLLHRSINALFEISCPTNP